MPSFPLSAPELNNILVLVRRGLSLAATELELGALAEITTSAARLAAFGQELAANSQPASATTNDARA